MNTVAFFGVMAFVALVVASMMSWIEDLRRFRGATSASESRAQNDRARRDQRRDQSERIRDAYMSKEQRAREMRERIRKERIRREKAREAAGFRRQAPPPPSGADRASSDRPSTPRTTSAEDRYRATLDLMVGEITPERLRANYRRLVAAYHPDRVSGLGEKLQRLAEEETKAINEAYNFFKRRIGP